MAEAYFVSFARNLAFQDAGGNKRIAWAVASIFLQMNGFDVEFSDHGRGGPDSSSDVATGKDQEGSRHGSCAKEVCERIEIEG